MSRGLQLYLDFVVFIFGAGIGSFLNVCVHRLPREQSIVNPPSHCPQCNQPIHWYDNIPLLSYLQLRGRCRHCHVRISPRYFLVELLTGVLFLLVWLKHTGWVIPIYWVLLAGLIVSTFIDFEHYIIPNEITYGGIVTGLILSAIYPPLQLKSAVLPALLQSVLGILVGGLLLLAIALIGERVFKKEAMGMGDVKFLAAIGAFLGYRATLFTIFVSSVSGAVIGLGLILLSKRDWQGRIPYGPYIALGAMLWIFCGREVIQWYVNLMAVPPLPGS